MSSPIVPSFLARVQPHLESRGKRPGSRLRSGIISLASCTDLLYCAARAGHGPRFMIMATVLDDIPAPAA